MEDGEEASPGGEPGGGGVIERAALAVGGEPGGEQRLAAPREEARQIGTGISQRDVSPVDDARERIRGMGALWRGREGKEGPRRAAGGAARAMRPVGGQAAQRPWGTRLPRPRSSSGAWQGPSGLS